MEALSMTRYVALIDGQPGAFGVVIPDCPGCAGMGDTIEEALDNAAEGLRDWMEAIEAQGGAAPVPRSMDEVRAEADADPDTGEVIYATVPLIRDLGRPVKANLSLDSGVLAAIDATARRLGVTRSAMVELLAKRGLPAFG
jgi:predicted RNase H-like HicB family nuclease